MAEERGDTSASSRQAGRGVISIALAKYYFIVVAAIIELRLPVVLGSTLFGAYRLVTSTISPLNNAVITGTIQAVSRYTAQRPERARALQRAGLRMHVRVGLPLAIVFIALAPVTAIYVFRDPEKTGPLMLAGLILAGYSFYAVLVGTANGTRQFHKQAALDVCFATLRAGGILGLAMVGLGVMGAFAGWVAAVGVILVIAAVAVGLPRREKSAEPGPMLRFFIPVAGYLILFNLLMFVDQMLLKRLSTDWFAAHADQIRATLTDRLPASFLGAVEDGVDEARAADGQVGLYGAAQNLARLSYQAIVAATFVVFPLVSRSTFEEDRETTRAYIHTTLRYALVFSAAIAVVFAANPRELLSVPYPTEFAYLGAPALIALSLGTVAFCVFAIAGTILNGAGLARLAVAASAVTLVLAAGANAVVIPLFSPGRELLLACGVATGGSMVAGAALAGALLKARLGAFLPPLTALRVAIAGVGAIALGRVYEAEGVVEILAEGIFIGLSFFAILIATRELTGRDLRAVSSVFKRKREES